ncbi:hypothetical protein DL240_04880 [Lujinxingia litoralis]|uniref:Uncharacterized protein n=2 Tax=Lujinxingia litoralis TaxID=2211119 RepID=A0A328CAH9_9DELT|nr:hypothetical protein DL240_04880 [Lujinxingia litoralis]
MALSGEADEPADVVLDEVPSFRAYGGSGAPAAPKASPRPEVRIGAKSAKEAETVYDEPEEPDWRISEVDVIGKEIDGKRIIADSSGEPMSKIEAEIRAKKMVQAIDESEYEFERRARVRDAINSRLMVPSREGIGRVEVAPGVRLGEGLQQRLREKYGQTDAPIQQRRKANFLEEEEAFLEDEAEYFGDEDLLDEEYYEEGEVMPEDESWDEVAY